MITSCTLNWMSSVVAWTSKAILQSCFAKKVFSKISQNSRENTCTRVLSCVRVSFLVNFCPPVVLSQLPLSVKELFHWKLLTPFYLNICLAVSYSDSFNFFWPNNYFKTWLFEPFLMDIFDILYLVLR